MSSVCPKLSLFYVVQTGSSPGLNTLQSTYVSRNIIVLTMNIPTTKISLSQAVHRDWKYNE